MREYDKDTFRLPRHELTYIPQIPENTAITERMKHIIWQIYDTWRSSYDISSEFGQKWNKYLLLHGWIVLIPFQG